MLFIVLPMGKKHVNGFKHVLFFLETTNFIKNQIMLKTNRDW